jgi:hypothetical protein
MNRPAPAATRAGDPSRRQTRARLAAAAAAVPLLAALVAAGVAPAVAADELAPEATASSDSTVAPDTAIVPDTAADAEAQPTDAATAGESSAVDVRTPVEPATPPAASATGEPTGDRPGAPEVAFVLPDAGPGGWFPGRTRVGLEFLANTTYAYATFEQYQNGVFRGSYGSGWEPGRLGDWVSREGVTTLRVIAVNNSPYTTEMSIDVSVDSTAPEIEQVSPLDGARVPLGAGVTPTAVCDDPDSFIVSCSIDGYALGEPIFFDQVGVHTLTFRAVNASGLETVREIEVAVVEGAVAPTLSVPTIVHPASGWLTTPQTITLTAASDSDIESIDVFQLGVGVTSYPGSSATFVVDADGEHAFSVSARDADGDISEAQEFQVRLDATAPEITVTHPTDATVVALRSAAPRVFEFRPHEVVTLDYVCDDPTSGVVTCEGDLATGDRLPTSVPGAHSVTLRATDAAGNASTLVVRYVVAAEGSSTPGGQPATGGVGGPAGGSDAPVSLAVTGTDASARLGVGSIAILAGIAGVLALFSQRSRAARTRTTS